MNSIPWVAIIGDDGQRLFDFCNKTDKFPDRVIFAGETPCSDFYSRLYKDRNIWFYRMGYKWRMDEFKEALPHNAIITLHNYSHDLPYQITDAYTTFKMVVCEENTSKPEVDLDIIMGSSPKKYAVCVRNVKNDFDIHTSDVFIDTDIMSDDIVVGLLTKIYYILLNKIING